MECKNCRFSLAPDENYCPKCGARVIRNRLTLKNILEDIYEQHLNLDNRLFLTIAHLFTRPGEVVTGFLQGLRKRYLNPVSYLGLAITLSGIVVLVIKKHLLNKLAFDVMNTGTNTAGANKIFETTLDYQNFLFVFLIPLMSAIGWLVYARPRYNFTEHLVTMSYVLAHITIVTFPITVLLLYLDPVHFVHHSFINIAVILVYTAYVYRQMCDYRPWTFLGRTVLYLIVFLIIYILFSILIVVFLLVSGTISLEEIRPA